MVRSEHTAMFGTLGGPEIILILVLALIIFGPRKLPEIGKSMGRMLAEFRKASNDFKRTLEEEVELEKTRLPEPAPPIGEPAVQTAGSGSGASEPAPAAPPATGEEPVVASPSERRVEHH